MSKGMKGLTNYKFQVIDLMGDPIPSGLSVTVTNSSGTSQTIYKEDQSTSLTNPILSAALDVTTNAEVSFWGAPSGLYAKVTDGANSVFAALSSTTHKIVLGATEIYGLESPANVNLDLNTATDTKPVRINSRDYTQTSGSGIGVQCKPNQSVTGTASITGGEFSPRFAAGIGGSDLIGLQASPLLKAGAGDLTGKVAGLEINIDFGISGTRTITGDVSGVEAFLAIPSTYTYSGAISLIRVRDVNIKGWDYFLNLDSTGVGLLSTDAGTYSTANGYLKCLFGSSAYRIPVFTGTD